MLSPTLESRDLSLLDEELQEKFAALRERCRLGGILLEVALTIRGPAAQARDWCRSRSVAEVAGTRNSLSGRCPTIASLLRDEYAAWGPQATDNLPGNDWHQWGQALDVFVDVGGTAVWSGSLHYVVNLIAEELGFFGMFGPRESAKRYHLQLRRFRSVLSDRDFAGNWSGLEKRLLATYDFGEKHE
jgi:hypothetical protein